MSQITKGKVLDAAELVYDSDTGKLNYLAPSGIAQQARRRAIEDFTSCPATRPDVWHSRGYIQVRHEPCPLPFVRHNRWSSL